MKEQPDEEMMIDMKDNNSFPFEATHLRKFVHKKGNNNAVCANFR